MSGSARGVKRAKQAGLLASLLEKRIADSGWPVGLVMGSESELLERFSVTRATLREAIRILEHEQVATMRRGPGGGLVLIAPDSQAAVRATALGLSHRRATWAHIFEARAALEVRMVGTAAERIHTDGVRRLREALDREAQIRRSGHVGSHGIHIALAEATGNPAFVLFVDVLTQLTAPAGHLLRSGETATEVAHAHERIVGAVIAGDAAMAQRRMRRHLEAMSVRLTPSAVAATDASVGDVASSPL